MLSLISLFIFTFQYAQYESAVYTLKENLGASNLLDAFDFFTAGDPTNGKVQYVDRKTAEESGLIMYYNHSVVLKVENTGNVDMRKSIRIESKNIYNGGVFILNLKHMPTGCGTWPAFWTTDPTTVPVKVWPHNGEWDFLESVNEDQFGTSTSHSDRCDLPSADRSKLQTAYANETVHMDFPAYGGNPAVTDIYNPNQLKSANTCGKVFNENGGGFYIGEWDPLKGTRVWAFSRQDLHTNPKVVDFIYKVLDDRDVDPDTLPTPDTFFPFGPTCPSDGFKNHKVIINTSLCGDWAGKQEVWSKYPNCASKAPTCAEFVRNFPEAFSEAYWSIKSLRIYQKK